MRRTGVFSGAEPRASTFIAFSLTTSSGLLLVLTVGSVLRLLESLSRTSRLGNSAPILRARRVFDFRGEVCPPLTGGEFAASEPLRVTASGGRAAASAAGVEVVGRGASVAATLGATADRDGAAERVAMAAAAAAAARTDITALEFPVLAAAATICAGVRVEEFGSPPAEGSAATGEAVVA
jgi:hypothetical protein